MANGFGAGSFWCPQCGTAYGAPLPVSTATTPTWGSPGPYWSWATGGFGPLGPTYTSVGPMPVVSAGYGLGGLRRWGGTYSPQYTATGLPTDEEIEEMIYDAIDDDPAVPWDIDVDVSSDGGVVTLTGNVPSKRIKHAIGNDAWFIPGVVDVHNNLTVTGRRRLRAAARAGGGGAQEARAAAQGQAPAGTQTGATPGARS